MYKLFLALFIIFPGYSCNYTSKHTRKQGVTRMQRAALSISDNIPDSNLVNLRSFNVIAVTDILCRDWSMEDADQKHWSAIFWDSLQDKRKYPGFSLFHDYTLTENPRTGISFGRWEVDKPNRMLYLKMKDGSKKSYYIRELSLSSMVLTWEQDGETAWVKLIADSLVHREDKDDPFHPANNLWRLKPSKSESAEQIKKRVKNCVQFYSAFFKDNYQRQLTDISFIGLPTCFEWYNGGIGLPAVIELDKKWKQCFYSEDQAHKGYALLKDLLEKHVLEWPDKHLLWTKRIQIVLDQMNDRL